MPLLIDLKPGEKIIINGAVIENTGTNTKLRIHNKSNILRQKEILAAEDAQTPASRVYYCLQCAYVFEGKQAEYLDAFRGYLTEYAAAAPSALDIVKEISTQVDAGQHYKALKAARKLLQHEVGVLADLEKGVAGSVGEE